jgi:hypothetical protein
MLRSSRYFISVGLLLWMTMTLMTTISYKVGDGIANDGGTILRMFAEGGGILYSRQHLTWVSPFFVDGEVLLCKC